MFVCFVQSWFHQEAPTPFFLFFFGFLSGSYKMLSTKKKNSSRHARLEFHQPTPLCRSWPSMRWFPPRGCNIKTNNLYSYRSIFLRWVCVNRPGLQARGRRTSWQAPAEGAAEWLSENKAISERALEKTNHCSRVEREREWAPSDRRRAKIWLQLLAGEEIHWEYGLLAKQEANNLRHRQWKGKYAVAECFRLWASLFYPVFIFFK